MADVSVRPAGAADAPELAALQTAAWVDAYAGELPRETVASLAGDPAEHADWWRESVVSPPSPRHRVLVALDAREPVGLAALGPAGDDDTDPAVDAEVLTFVVSPAHRRAGHGSRLLAAAVDHLRGDGFERAIVWIDATDEAGRALLVSSGWATDGSFRTLDLEGDGRVVLRQVRLHTDLREEPP